MDTKINTFGRKLLNLCKSSGLRILNGRHKADPTGYITFYNATGKSLIDYVLVDCNTIDSVNLFSYGNFNVYSDHSPVSFSISYDCPIVDKQNDRNDMNLSGRTSCKTVRWNDENSDDILDKIRM